ncbi:hypothetical protein QOZ88_19330 [Blastococcus sp. BMG 814]|uniref:Uncharacterized protein n=1 Tax=Blastococcus carthaginiensis TaxID=3050034 RepID=A0ABT9IGT1_9ACTN|nr:hypothetical protein [Blastococcus carthaginiensis]MDP5184791.1 hypothetical protein [Blastococcus carthaginiensis]
MMVRAGGLTLRAPDTMPEAARQHVQELQAFTVLADVAVATGHASADFSAAWPHIAAVEVITFGRRRAERLRRCGKAARLAAHHQLVQGWGQGVHTTGALPCR